MSGGRTLVAAVGDYSFDQIRSRGFYACPASYGRGECDYLAIYRGRPVSGVTHYAAIEGIHIERGVGEHDVGDGPVEQGGVLGRMDRLRMFPEAFDAPAQVYMLGELVELDPPVTSKNRWVQSAIYCDIKDLKRATYVDDLLADKHA